MEAKRTPGVEAEHGGRADPAKGRERLGEDLLAVRHEEHPPRPRSARVEGREPGLPEARREDDEPRGIALGSCARARRAPLAAPRAVREAAVTAPGPGRRGVSAPWTGARCSGPP